MSRALLLAVAENAGNLSVLDPASPPAASIHELFYLVLGIAAAIFVLVEGLILYFIVKFRHRGGDRQPPQVYGSKPIEMAWTVAPALIVFVLFLVVIRTIGDVQALPEDAPPGSKPLRVTVVGRQWWWEYVYESYAGQKLTAADGPELITANELHVPVSRPGDPRPVYFQLRSADVVHSFWVPRLAGKIDVFPDRLTRLWFQPSATGLYLGQCAEYCGTQHANMRIRVVVQEPAEFEAWLRQQQQPAVDEAAVAAGRQAFLTQSCVNCHRIRGTRARGTFGPDLTHLASRQTLATFVPNDHDTLHRWIVDPQKIKPGCPMPAMNLSAQQVDEVARYLQSLK